MDTADKLRTGPQAAGLKHAAAIVSISRRLGGGVTR
jgi:hypothetical protein